MMHLIRHTGKRCPTYSNDQCIDIFARIWANVARHEEAAKGYKRTGTLNALDESEDGLIVREAKTYWDRLGMRHKREKVIHDVDVEYKAGRLRWCSSHIQGLIVPYPKRGHMDTIEDCQDDGDSDGKSVADSASEHSLHGDGADDDESEEIFEVEDAPEGAPEGAGAPTGSLGEGTTELCLSYDQAKAAAELHDRLAKYEQARKLLESLGDLSGSMALARTMHAEKRKATGRHQPDLAIAQALTQQLADEFEEDARKRIEYAKAREAQAEATKAKKEAMDAKRQTAATRARLKEAHTFLECAAACKKYSPRMLGEGFKDGGPKQCRELRFEVLDRLLAQSRDALTPQQKNDWQWFKREWDAKMGAEYNKTWGSRFAGIVQHLLSELADGKTSAVADFMHNETVRVLSSVPVLKLP